LNTPAYNFCFAILSPAKADFLPNSRQTSNDSGFYLFSCGIPNTPDTDFRMKNNFSSY